MRIVRKIIDMVQRATPYADQITIWFPDKHLLSNLGFYFDLLIRSLSLVDKSCIETRNHKLTQEFFRSLVGDQKTAAQPFKWCSELLNWLDEESSAPDTSLANVELLDTSLIEPRIKAEDWDHLCLLAFRLLGEPV